MRRSNITRLPPELKAWLDAELVRRGFGDYVALARDLIARGGEASKSGLHRYGSQLERKLAAIRASTEASRLLARAAPDQEADLGAATLAMVHSQLFDVMLGLTEAQETEDAHERLKILSRVGSTVSDLVRAGVGRNRWLAEWRAKAGSDLAQIEGEAKKDKLTPAEVIGRIRSAYGLDQPPASPAP